MSKIKTNLALVVISSLIALLVAELAVRLVLPPPGFVPVNEPVGLLIEHPTRHYAYTPGFEGSVTTDDYSIEIEINSIGFREDPIGEQEEIDILAVGDSFTVGFGVQANEAWPSRLESYLNDDNDQSDSFRVVNGGVSGYSLAQIRLLTSEFLRLDPKLVILGLYPSAYWRLDNPYVYYGGDAVLRDVVPQLELTEGGFIRGRFQSEPLRQTYIWLARYFHTGAYAMDATDRLYTALRSNWSQGAKTDSTQPRDAAAILEPLMTELNTVKELTDSHGVPLIVLLIGYQETDGTFSDEQRSFNQALADFCRARSIRFLDVFQTLERSATGQPTFRLNNDHHWSATAHDLVAHELAAFLAESDLVPAANIDATPDTLSR